MKRHRINSKIQNPANFRMVETELAQSEQDTWHYHNNISDTFYVISGEMKLLIESPAEEVCLSAGQTHTIRPSRPHSVVNNGAAPMHFVLLQGVGDYDYVPVEQPNTNNKD